MTPLSTGTLNIQFNFKFKVNKKLQMKYNIIKTPGKLTEVAQVFMLFQCEKKSYFKI